MTPRVVSVFFLCCPALAPVASAADVDARHAPFLGFESGPVNSILATRDGSRLLVLNTSDDRVEVFRIVARGGSTKRGAASAGATLGTASSAGGTIGSTGTIGAAGDAGAPLAFEGAIFTGLEPVALVQHPTDDSIVFVANHVSDTVSVIDLDVMSVVASIPVGDEPQGLAIAADRLFVACSHAPRTPMLPGQVLPGPIDENVVVSTQIAPPYAILGNAVLDAVKPRDVAVAGGVVYAAIENSGNHTTLLDETKAKQLGIEQVTPDAFDGGPFAVNPVLVRPELNPLNYARGWYVPNAGRIVFDAEHPTLVPQLHDDDVFAIDAATGAPLPWRAHGVGTTLYSIAVAPTTGKLWVTNTDARNRVRFEPRLRGDAVVNRVTIVDPGNGATQAVLLPAALPGAITFTPATFGGPALAFVAMQGSGAVLALDAVTGAFVRRIDVGPIPSGLAFDAARRLLFVHTRGDQRVRAFDATRVDAMKPAGAPVALSFDAEPPLVRAGRLHLYAAPSTTACASCHVFGHDDGIAWDLGDPEGALSNYFPDVLTGLGSYPGQPVIAATTPLIHPMKGPMVTQSLRGLMDPNTKDDLPLHWRGDRRTFHQFQGAFSSLLGGPAAKPRDLQEFAGFLRSLRYAPNPFEPRDRVYVGADASGADTYGMNPSFHGKQYGTTASTSCIDCHVADFFAKDDFTGSRPVASAGSFTQLFQTAQLRMVYEKHFRDVNGFGLLHDGAVNGVRGFMDFTIPNGGGPTFSNFTTQDKDEVASFVEHFDHGLSPQVGAQFTLDASSVVQAKAFLDFAETRAKPPFTDFDLILKGYRTLPSGEILPRGALFTWSAAQQKWGYQFDTGDFVDRSIVIAVAQAGIVSFTFTCVPPGEGVRLGIDRDEDGALDFIERTIGTDPARADSDGDGYTDGFERALGSDPLHADAALADATPPSIELARGLEIGSGIATIEVVTDEPTTLSIAIGGSPPALDATLRRRHDVILEDLAEGAAISALVTATDKNGNASTATAAFATLPKFLHVDAITIEKSGTGPYTATARVKVVDRHAQPAALVPLMVFFAGDIGGQAWQRTGITDAAGVATIALVPFTPSSSTQVAASVAWLGSVDPQSPWFVGVGGGIPSFYYDATENRAAYASVTVP